MTSELKVDKITPASGTNTQIGEAGDTTNLSAGTVTLPTSIITGATEKTSLVDADKFLIADSADSNAFKHVQKSNLPSGGLVPTGQVDGSGSGAVVLNSIFSSTYTNYIVIVDKLVPASGGAAVYMQFRDDSGGLGGSNYGYSNRALAANNGNEDNSDGDGQTQVKFAGGGISGDANKLGMRMVMYVQDPFTSSVYTGFHGTYGFISNSGYANSGYLGGLYHDNDSVTGLQLYLNTGGNLSARIKAYGVVDS